MGNGRLVGRHMSSQVVKFASLNQRFWDAARSTPEPDLQHPCRKLSEDPPPIFPEDIPSIVAFLATRLSQKRHGCLALFGNRGDAD